MTRYRTVVDLSTGETVTIAYTPQEEAIADAIESGTQPIDERYPPLEPWQFWSIIDLSGIGEQALRDAIALIPDEAFKIKALRKLANPPGGKFLRSDPLFNNSFLMTQIGKTEEEINQLWLAAAALE